MEEILNEQTQATAQTAGAEENKGAEKQAVSLGKFKDAESLLSAYNSLQSEFTKRCQKIKELECRLSAGDKTEVPPTEETAPNKADIDKDDKTEILKEYLLEVLGKKPSAIILDGVGAGVKTPNNRPKTIKEAGSLAENLLKNQ